MQYKWSNYTLSIIELPLDIHYQLLWIGFGISCCCFGLLLLHKIGWLFSFNIRFKTPVYSSGGNRNTCSPTEFSGLLCSGFKQAVPLFYCHCAGFDVLFPWRNGKLFKAFSGNVWIPQETCHCRTAAGEVEILWSQSDYIGFSTYIKIIILWANTFSKSRSWCSVLKTSTWSSCVNIHLKGWNLHFFGNCILVFILALASWAFVV